MPVLSAAKTFVVANVTAKQDKTAEDVQRLFAELDHAYQRAAEAASPAIATDTSSRGKLLDEGGKALDIIRRIRAMDGL
jgi:hypothetical protein